MLMAVGEFCDHVESNLAGLVDELTELTGRTGPTEANAWRRSLPRLSVLLSHGKLADFHLQLGQPGAISLEYRLPVSSSWCDAVLLGYGVAAPAAVMLELKDWDVQEDQAATRPGLVFRHGSLWSHPSDQVGGYVEYCRHFHSTVLAENAEVSGCVFFTTARDVGLYAGAPYTDLVARYPVFSSAEPDMGQAFPDYLRTRLTRPDYGFASRFEAGTYAQDRNFLNQLSVAILDPDNPVFVLLDRQRLGYEACLLAVDKVLASTDQDEKAVVVIQGPPGSGKSVLAAKLWAQLVQDPRIHGRVVLTSTSSAQRANWQARLQEVKHDRAARGVVIGSNRYNPGMTSTWWREWKEPLHLDVASWKRNYETYLELGGANASPDDFYDVSVVDEAHALINPAVKDKEGAPSSGWFMPAGPQAWHIMRSSRISIFLLDTEQSYRDNETTTDKMIREWAGDLGVRTVESVDLGDGQFRCGGSKEYVDWLEAALGLHPETHVDTLWRRTATNPKGLFTFELVDDPQALDEHLRLRLKEGRTARLVSSYSRKWVTKGKTPHRLPPDQLDFHLPYGRDGQLKYWSRPWNYLGDRDSYDLFVQAPTGSPMEQDPLCEVGCPYVVRGFDFDYLGVLWLGDLVWRDGAWRADVDQIYETAWQLTLGRARREHRRGVRGAVTENLVRQLQRGYRILLSRAIYGVYVWVEDPETRAHIAALLNK